MTKSKTKRTKAQNHAYYLSRKTRGHHPGEVKQYPKRQGRGRVIGKGKSAYPGKHKKPIQKRGRLEKKAETWALYSYFDGVSNQNSTSDSEILGMTSYDLTKTQYKNYDSEALFAMHQYMERALQFYLKLEMGLADISEINIEVDTEYKTKHRRFLWQLTDMESGEIRYHLIYEKGQTIEKEMWEGFDSLDFKINIRELKLWE